MKKVECPSCGGTGVLRGWHRSTWVINENHRCYKCSGFGFILKDHAKLSKVYPNSTKARFIPFGELKEFTGLVKVRNISNVFIHGRGLVPYSVFYKEHRNPQ